MCHMGLRAQCKRRYRCARG